MPPGSTSRHLFTFGVRSSDGDLYLTNAKPYRYRMFSDSIVHIARGGDSWQSIAGKYYVGMPRACGFWWAISDFQPSPVVDPTLDLEIGSRVIVPSLRVLTDIIIGERRRREYA